MSDRDLEETTEATVDTGTDGEAAYDLEEVPDDDDGVAVRYEIVFDARDRMVGGRLVARLEEVVAPTWTVRRTEEGPVWASTVEFPSRARAERFFRGDFYRQFCSDVRRSTSSSVLVVPLGPQTE